MNENIYELAKKQSLVTYIQNNTLIKIKKIGNGYRAVECCFCEGKKNALSIKDDYFKCFSCGEKGDVVSFVSKYKKIKPLHAAKLLLNENFIPTLVEEKVSDSKSLFQFIWNKSEKIDFNKVYIWLTSKRAFPPCYAEKATEWCVKHLKVNIYKDEISIVVPIYSYNSGKKELIGIENINLDDSSKKAHGSKGGFLSLDADSYEVVVVESFVNALCLWSVGITSIAVFGSTNTECIPSIFEEFSRKKVYLWFDKGTEVISEKVMLTNPTVQAIYFEEGKEDKFDVNDLLKQSQGNFLLEVNRYIEQATKSEASLEKDLLIQRNKVPQFPVNTLPEPMKSFCTQVADAITCPVDFVITPMLSIVGGVIGNSKKIEIKNSWTEKSAIYSAVVADPGSGKSPALAKVTNLLKEIEESNSIQNEVNKLAHQQALAEYEVELNLWKKRKRQGSEEAPPKQPEDFSYIRTHVADATVESLSEILANNPQGVVLVRDELTAWVNSHNQYKGGSGSDRQFYLSVWAGASSPVDRKGKAPQYLTDPFLSITGAIPPKELDKLKKGIKDDGFLDRILFSYPDPITPTTWSENEICPQIENLMQRLIIDLYKDNQEHTVKFSQQAKEEWVLWYESHKKTSLQQDEILQNPLNKMPGQLLRISLILAVVKKEESLSKETFDCAVQIIEYYKKHLKRVLGILDETDDEEKIRKLIVYAKKRKMRSISAQNIYQSRFMKIQKSGPAKELLKWAADQGIGVYKKNTIYFDESVFDKFEL